MVTAFLSTCKIVHKGGKNGVNGTLSGISLDLRNNQTKHHINLEKLEGIVMITIFTRIRLDYLH